MRRTRRLGGSIFLVAALAYLASSCDQGADPAPAAKPTSTPYNYGGGAAGSAGYLGGGYAGGYTGGIAGGYAPDGSGCTNGICPPASDVMVTINGSAAKQIQITTG